MPYYRVIYRVRNSGALGVFHDQQCLVSAVNEEQSKTTARQLLQDFGFETSHAVSVEKMPDTDEDNPFGMSEEEKEVSRRIDEERLAKAQPPTRQNCRGMPEGNGRPLEEQCNCLTPFGCPYYQIEDFEDAWERDPGYQIQSRKD